MTDKVSPEKRSRIMASVRSRDTVPELLIRRGLHGRGFRYKLHDAGIPGKPDLVFPRYDAVLLVNGCFWHGHDCHMLRIPKSNSAYWKRKIRDNAARDAANLELLREQGWRVLVIWECALRGKTSLPIDEVIEMASSWLLSANDYHQLKGC